jgi:hypothetical protein
MNDLDFVTLVRSAVVAFMLSTNAFAFVTLSKAMRVKNFGALPSIAVTPLGERVPWTMKRLAKLKLTRKF